MAFYNKGNSPATIAGARHTKSQKGNSISLRCHQNSAVISYSVFLTHMILVCTYGICTAY